MSLVSRLRWLLAIAGILGSLVAGPALAGETCKAPERDAANALLQLTASEQQASLSRTFPWGAPVSQAAGSHEHLLVQKDYSLDYDDSLMGPLWSADQFGFDRLKGGRVDCFRADPRLAPAIASDPGDYDEPIFDQGHIVPNGDMTFERTAILNTFVMSNMSPQFCEFNRGVWQILETIVRVWAGNHDRLYVVSGAVFDRDGDGVRDDDAQAVRMRSRSGKTRVAVPSAFYKIVAYPQADGSLHTIAILLPHDQTDLTGKPATDYLGKHVVPISTIEAVTGLKFFPGFEGQRVEAKKLWNIKGIAAKSLATKCPGKARLTGAGPAVYTLH